MDVDYKLLEPCIKCGISVDSSTVANIFEDLCICQDCNSKYVNFYLALLELKAMDENKYKQSFGITSVPEISTPESVKYIEDWFRASMRFLAITNYTVHDVDPHNIDIVIFVQKNSTHPRCYDVKYRFFCRGVKDFVDCVYVLNCKNYDDLMKLFFRSAASAFSHIILMEKQHWNKKQHLLE